MVVFSTKKAKMFRSWAAAGRRDSPLRVFSDGHDSMEESFVFITKPKMNQICFAQTLSIFLLPSKCLNFLMFRSHYAIDDVDDSSAAVDAAVDGYGYGYVAGSATF